MVEFYSYEEKVQAIRNIANFNSLITLKKINNYDIHLELIDDIRKECIKILDLYKFNIESSNIDLLKQIRDFCNYFCDPEDKNQCETTLVNNKEDNIQDKVENNSQLIIYQKENLFSKILCKIRNIFKINK